MLSPSRFSFWVIGLLAMSMGLVFFLIVVMDRPFTGDESISPNTVSH